MTEIRETSADIVGQVTTRKGLKRIFGGRGPWSWLKARPREVADGVTEATKPEKKTLEGALTDLKSRRGFLRLVGKLAVAGGLYFLGRELYPLGNRYVEKTRVRDDIERAEIEWTYLLRGGKIAGDEPRKMVEIWLPELSGDQRLDNYESWANNTHLGFYVQGLHGFVDDLRKQEGRRRLMDLISKYETQIDLSGAREGLKALENYAQGRN